MPLYFFHLSFGDRTVADEGGEFLRMPIGHPALEVVTSDGQQPQAESFEMKPIRPAGTVATRQGRRSASLVQQMSAVRKQTEQLLQRNQQLRHESFPSYVSPAKA